MDDQLGALRVTLHNVSVKVAALHDVIVLLLAREARSSGDPERMFTDFSGGLDQRLNKAQSLGMKVDAAKEIRAQFDTIMASARRFAVGP